MAQTLIDIGTKLTIYVTVPIVIVAIVWLLVVRWLNR